MLHVCGVKVQCFVSQCRCHNKPAASYTSSLVCKCIIAFIVSWPSHQYSKCSNRILLIFVKMNANKEAGWVEDEKGI